METMSGNAQILLTFLHTNPEHFFTRDELADAVWEGRQRQNYGHRNTGPAAIKTYLSQIFKEIRDTMGAFGELREQVQRGRGGGNTGKGRNSKKHAWFPKEGIDLPTVVKPDRGGGF